MLNMKSATFMLVAATLMNGLAQAEAKDWLARQYEKVMIGNQEKLTRSLHERNAHYTDEYNKEVIESMAEQLAVQLDQSEQQESITEDEPAMKLGAVKNRVSILYGRQK